MRYDYWRPISKREHDLQITKLSQDLRQAYKDIGFLYKVVSQFAAYLDMAIYTDRDGNKSLVPGDDSIFTRIAKIERRLENVEQMDCREIARCTK